MIPVRTACGANRRLPDVLRATAVYRPERHHAHGGLGEVLTAHQEELDRTVALKRIRPDKLHDTARRRFLREAAITARLQHPGIVPIYGLGQDDDGPFYTMPFIEGQTLQEAIDAFHGDESLRRDPGRRSLKFRGLLQQFIAVCNTVAYAHDQGVVHRDLKPSNIMLGPYGETLVMDWGLAKRFGADDAGARGRRGRAVAEPVARRPDGHRRRAGDAAVHEPGAGQGRARRPGQRHLQPGAGPLRDPDREVALRRCECSGARTRSRRCARRRSCRRAGGTRACPVPWRRSASRPWRRDPRIAIASARALADDLARWLADEPVSAWREPVELRLRRWMRRHRTAVASAVVAILMALAGTMAILAVQTRANRDLQVSNHALAAANRRERERFDLALEAIGLFHGQVSEDLLLKEKQFDILRTKLLRGAVAFYDRLEGLLESQTDPESRLALSRAYEELGNVTSQIAEKPAALAMHRKALAVRRELAARAEAEPGTQVEVARSLLATGRLSEEMGDTTLALASYEEAIGLIQALPATIQSAEKVRSVLGEAHLRTGWVLFHIGRRVKALAALEQARAIFQALADAHPALSQYRSDLASSYQRIGFVLRQSSRPAEALAAMEQARTTFQSLADANPGAIQFQNDLAIGHNQLGNFFRQLNRVPAALESYKQARAIFQRLAGAYPGITKFQSELARSHGSLGVLLSRTGQRAEALASLKEAREIQQALADADPSVAALQSDLAITEQHISQIYGKMGRASDALASLENARAIQQALVDAYPAITQFRGELAVSQGQIGALFQSAGRVKEAAMAYRRARRSWSGCQRPALSIAST